MTNVALISPVNPPTCSWLWFLPTLAICWQVSTCFVNALGIGLHGVLVIPTPKNFFEEPVCSQFVHRSIFKFRTWMLLFR
mmetsp:Transcript_20100/g.33490  ORF Transcript_20100/g.33490 Transcript_20100/m.33490 type:complete len:80 (-) Transcript_20100:237-476(-)